MTYVPDTYAGGVTIERFTAQAMRIHSLYDRLNLHQRGRTWNREEFVLGFVGDVGDLDAEFARLVDELEPRITGQLRPVAPDRAEAE